MNRIISYDENLTVKSILAASVACGDSHIENVDTTSERIYSAIELVRRAGVIVSVQNNTVTVRGRGKYVSIKSDKINGRGYNDMAFLSVPIFAGANEVTEITDLIQTQSFYDTAKDLQKLNINVICGHNSLKIVPSETDIGEIYLSPRNQILYDAVLLASLYSSSQTVIYAYENYDNTLLRIMSAMRLEYYRSTFLKIPKFVELSPLNIAVGLDMNEVVEDILSSSEEFSKRYFSVRCDDEVVRHLLTLKYSGYKVKVKYISNGYFPLADIEITSPHYSSPLSLPYSDPDK